MQKIFDLIVDRKKAVLLIMAACCVLCAALSRCVYINADMTKYLPADSQMKQGIDLLAEEFPDLNMPSTIRVMFRDLPWERIGEFSEQLSAIDGVDTVNVSGLKGYPAADEALQAGQNKAVQTGSELHDADAGTPVTESDLMEESALSEPAYTYVLYTVSTAAAYRTPEELAIEQEIRDRFSEYYMTLCNDDTTGMTIPLFVYAAAGVLLFLVLFTMCRSWVEPFLFLTAIGMAIVINMGTNLLLGSVSQTTDSMSSILQLVLSMDYSIILMNRFRQEKEKAAAGGEESDYDTLMKRALHDAFPSIASSGFTTFVGLIMLVFMRFRIGKDLGLVLAKGVFWSMICVLTVLPGLILLFNRQVERTAKKALIIPTGRLAAFSYRRRVFLTAAFLCLFGLSWYLQTKSETSYSLHAQDAIEDIFPAGNQIVVVYENRDEEEMAKIALALEEDPAVRSVSAYATTLGRQMAGARMYEYLSEMSAMMGMEDGQDAGAMLDRNTVSLVYMYYGLSHAGEFSGTLSPEQFFLFVADDLVERKQFAGLLGEEMKEQIAAVKTQLTEGKAQLIGQTHSLMMLETSLPLEGEETTAWIRSLQETFGQKLAGQTYLIGNSPMNVEMKDRFGSERLMIELLTAAAIFLVVAVTFRSLLIPVILVGLVQCGVFMTIMTTWLLDYQIYYLAVVIVQCILMGATVDYAILYANYYRELRGGMSVQDAVRTAYERSVPTILTSSVFMILATAVIGVSPVEPTISQICLTIAIGASCATLLIIFILPGILAALDRFVCRRTDTE